MNTSNNLHKGMKGDAGKYNQSGFTGKRTGYNKHGQGIGFCTVVVFLVLLSAIVLFALYVTGMV